MTSPEEPELPVPAERKTAASLQNDATLVLVLGLTSIFFGPLGPFAFYLGRKYVAKCRRLDIEPDQGAVVGMYIGLVTGILFAVILLMCGGYIVFMLLFFVLWFVVMFVAVFGIAFL
jgi:hypothetical protein